MKKIKKKPTRARGKRGKNEENKVKSPQVLEEEGQK